jgi:ribonuclease HI
VDSATLRLYVDGGCSGNGIKDQAARRMCFVVTDEWGGVLVERLDLKGGSNNIAELMAVEAALEWCEGHGISSVEIVTDSQNTIAWATKRKPGKHLNDKTRVLGIMGRIATLQQSVHFEMTWVPREQNIAGHVIEAAQGL